MRQSNVIAKLSIVSKVVLLAHYISKTILQSLRLVRSARPSAVSDPVYMSRKIRKFRTDKFDT